MCNHFWDTQTQEWSEVVGAKQVNKPEKSEVGYEWELVGKRNVYIACHKIKWNEKGPGLRPFFMTWAQIMIWKVFGCRYIQSNKNIQFCHRRISFASLPNLNLHLKKIDWNFFKIMNLEIKVVFFNVTFRVKNVELRVLWTY